MAKLSLLIFQETTHFISLISIIALHSICLYSYISLFSVDLDLLTHPHNTGPHSHPYIWPYYQNGVDLDFCLC